MAGVGGNSFTADRTCAIRAGALYCWDDPVWDNACLFASHHQPVQVGTATDWDSISVGPDSTCGIRAGRLYCWGSNSNGQLATGDPWRDTLILLPD